MEWEQRSPCLYLYIRWVSPLDPVMFYNKLVLTTYFNNLSGCAACDKAWRELDSCTTVLRVLPFKEINVFVIVYFRKFAETEGGVCFIGILPSHVADSDHYPRRFHYRGVITPCMGGNARYSGLSLPVCLVNSMYSVHHMPIL